MKKIQLGIIYGSRSCEHEVSVISAVQLMKHVNLDKYDLVPVYISQEGAWYTGQPLRDIKSYIPRFNPKLEGVTRVQPDLTAKSGALLSYIKGGLLSGGRLDIAARLDCVIPVMHGLHGEDGSLQGLLELMDIPYASTGIGGSAIAMDKIMMKQFFRGCGFPVLDDIAVLRSAWRKDAVELIKLIEQKLPYPVFVKPATLGSSIGVSRATDFKSLSDALELAFSFDRRVMVEEAVNRPVEVNCSVLGFDDDVRASVVEMPITEGNLLDFSAKYTRGGGSKGMASLSRVVPAPIGEAMTKRIRELSCDIFRALDCKSVVRIDYMIDSTTDRLSITEINAIPGSLAFYLWNQSEPKLAYTELIDRMVQCAMTAYAEKCENNLAYRSDILKYASVGGAKGAKGTKG